MTEHSYCSLRDFKFEPGDLIQIFDEQNIRLVARTREYWESEQHLPELPHVQLSEDKIFTFLGIETIQNFTLCKWLVEEGIWFTCIHYSHEPFLKIKKLNEI